MEQVLVLMLRCEPIVYKLESIQARINRMAMGLKPENIAEEMGCLAGEELVFKNKMICFQITSEQSCTNESAIQP